jgi:hypothetical protein
MKWEYKTIILTSIGLSEVEKMHFNIDAELNKEGADGWELVSILPHSQLGSSADAPDSFQYTFKRPQGQDL